MRYLTEIFTYDGEGSFKIMKAKVSVLISLLVLFFYVSVTHYCLP